MTDRYFMHEGQRWRCSATNTPAAPAGRAAGTVPPGEGRTRLYFWSQAGVMRSVVYPANRRLTAAEFAAIPDQELRTLLLAPAATEMGRLTALHGSQ
jgi:hypothetical protein